MNKNDATLQEVDKVIVRISSEVLSYEVITPLNVEEEWELFKKNKYVYSPQLRYNEFDPEPYIQELEELVVPQDCQLGKMFERTRKELLTYCMLLRGLGTGYFPSEKYFGKVSEDLLMHAHMILDMKFPKIKPAQKTVSFEELTQRMKDEMKKYGINDWTFQFNKNASSPISIRGQSKVITIKEGVCISEFRAKKLLVHEIETHVLRAKNGDAQKYSIFRAGVPGYLPTEEGLAGYNERQQGFTSKQSMLRYAIRVIATKVAEKNGFMQVYTSVLPLVEDEEKAFRIAIRTKRGLGDTSQPGGYLKDHVYLQGMLLLEDFVQQGGDIKDLYAGKIRVEDVSLVKNNILKPATILPNFLKEQSP